MNNLKIKQGYIALKPIENLVLGIAGFRYPIMVLEMEEEIVLQGMYQKNSSQNKNTDEVSQKEQKSKYVIVYNQGLRLASKDTVENKLSQVSDYIDIKEGVDLTTIKEIQEEYKKQKQQSPSQFLVYLSLKISNCFEYCEMLPKFSYFQLIEITFNILMIYNAITSGFQLVSVDSQGYLYELFTVIGSLILFYIVKVIFNIFLRKVFGNLKIRQYEILNSIMKKQGISYQQIDVEIQNNNQYVFKNKNQELIKYDI
ncbi:hypothetical protein PPERSA_01094 [Pseudocohnilembus persalinus]|uniref:Transmembrane protein n=1 Tax=Pseudocohnilembus persalinus TaxID=266149 RepID=A0A0V0QVI8_PSEPJ|nr:hypothetical protein PPERSA_01094 [Pseudocohnilembus persalinus]|eukprot:KRX06016.1 hypothetical protein PPERSA_01094 [Pseudocohnilembus persalinus]